MLVRPALLLALAGSLTGSLAGPLAAQAPTDPTSCSLDGLTLFRNPDCRDAPPSWPIPAGGCLGASVLAVVGPAELQRCGLQAPFSFVTGHTDPATGREFALLCASNGFAVVDVDKASSHGPADPTTRAYARLENCFVPNPACGAIHRGTTSYGEFVYESCAFRPTLRVTRVRVTPSGAGQRDTVELRPFPDVPVPLGVSYRLTVDRERGHLYVPSAGGLHIYDVAGANAGRPVLRAIWRGWQTGTTLPSWDVHLQRYGSTVRAVVSEYLTSFANNHIAILDVTTLPQFDLAWTPPRWVAWAGSVPGSGNVHSAWMPRDGSLLYSSLGDVMTVVYDMSGFTLFGVNRELTPAEIPPLLPVPGSSSQPLVYPTLPRRHMGLQGLGYTGYASSWQDGFILYDLRPDCANPNEVLAQVDTSACQSGSSAGGGSCGSTYPGAFACYRLQDSGVVYVSDETNGLFLLRLNVGHVNRFGAGVADPQANPPLVPRIVLDHAPARTFVDPLRDGGQRITVRDLVPGRAVALMIATDGAPAGVPFPDAQSACRLWLRGAVIGPFFYFDLDNDGVVEAPLPPGIPQQWRVFVQAFSLMPAGSTLQCVGSSRGTWFGVAGPR